ncbi:hypothetical protein [Fodinibius sp.]|uniref:hypothetical protein n=1 Tax=Fodinibius sp. TaxID=1872440 RepID=UPI002ACE5DA0|nr:hypothetical protein [Fodinibius sp.]MDZ7657781.1 hypothetical protein [Fodinibius sp.]
MFTFILSLLISAGFYKLLEHFFSKEKDSINKTLGSLAFFFFLTIYYGSGYFGFKIPGSVFERNEYKAVVELKVKNENSIRLIDGKIQKSIFKGREQSYSQYYLLYLELPSGQKKYFTENNQLLGKALELESYVNLEDDSGDNWSICLQPLLPYYLWMNR